jgi:hypothetical protein
VRIPKRSPITRPLLKLPGEKLDNDLENLLDDHFVAPILMIAVIGAMCLTEWIGYLRNAPREPWLYTWWFIGASVVIAFHWRGQWKKAHAIKLGRMGERAVAEYLNIRLDADSRVLHGGCAPPRAVERSKIVNFGKEKCQSIGVSTIFQRPNYRRSLIYCTTREAIMSIVVRFPSFSLGRRLKVDRNQARIQEIEFIHDHPTCDAFPESKKIPDPFFEASQ